MITDINFDRICIVSPEYPKGDILSTLDIKEQTDFRIRRRKDDGANVIRRYYADGDGFHLE